LISKETSITPRLIKMRIVYVTIHVDPKIIQGGVGRKIKSQVSYWKEKGHTIAFFVLTPEEILLEDANQFIFKSHSAVAPLKFIDREINRALQLNRMIDAVGLFKPDLIYLRYGLYSYPLHRLFDIAPVILEINSNDLVEYRYRGPFFYWLNRITRDILFSLCAGWVASSTELANLKENRRHVKPVAIISNGIELDKYDHIQPPHNQRPSLTLVGSPGMNWHGVDKLIPFAYRCPDLAIHIVGYQGEDIDGPVPGNVHLHGYLGNEELKKVLAGTDVVFGTLALHRKKMEEASP